MNIQKSESQSQETKTDNKASNLIEYTQIEDTPFTIASKEMENTDEVEHYVLFGKYRVSERLNTMEKAKEEAKKLDWFKIMGVIHAIAETLIEAHEIKRQTKTKK